MSLPLISLLVAALLAPSQTRPRPVRQKDPLYDSTKVSFAHSLPAGVTHKAAQQAVITYGKIGSGKPLDRSDTLFLRQHDPAYLRAIALPASSPAQSTRHASPHH